MNSVSSTGPDPVSSVVDAPVPRNGAMDPFTGPMLCASPDAPVARLRHRSDARTEQWVPDCSETPTNVAPTHTCSRPRLSMGGRPGPGNSSVDVTADDQTRPPHTGPLATDHATGPST